MSVAASFCHAEKKWSWENIFVFPLLLFFSILFSYSSVCLFSFLLFTVLEFATGKKKLEK